MPSVIFSHKKIQEKEYLEQLLTEKEWFEREHFDVFLPKNKADIEQELIKKDELLKQKIAQLQKAWRNIEKNYFDAAEQLHYKKLLSKYISHISRFGPEGKYCRPNQIFIRLRTKRDETRALETIGHELFHLLFADLFEANRLNYSEREGMVDALILHGNFSKLFPQYQKQSIGKVRPKLLKSILT